MARDGRQIKVSRSQRLGSTIAKSGSATNLGETPPIQYNKNKQTGYTIDGGAANNRRRNIAPG